MKKKITKQRKRTSIYLSKALAEALENAASTSGRLSRICDRYLEIVKQLRPEQKFTPDELVKIVGCCDGVIFSPARIIDIDIVNNFTGSDWMSSAGAVIEQKIRRLSYPEYIALAEFIEKSQGNL